MMNDLLIKYIVGEASVEEISLVKAWRAERVENEQEYRRLYTIWEHSKSPSSGQEPDVDTAWAVLQHKMQQTAAPVKRMWPGRWKNAIAASVALLMVLSGLFVYQKMTGPREYTSDALAKVISLPDHSTITLNKYSKLVCEKGFNKKVRHVRLEGEGFFDIAKNKEKPFIIDVKDINVTVVGTSFNILSTKEKTEIAVESGIVKVVRNQESYTLRANDKITFKRNEDKAVVDQIQNSLYQYYRTNTFVCDNTPLAQLVAGLSDAYDTKIEVRNALLERQPITGKYLKADSLEPILQKVAMTLNAQLLKQGDVYILK
ncbi:hypothetical protein DBR32_15325 [Taibaiella sp. KBW10]|uniref:FecR family protein n=1 Tax=Taibaiella sp. KBW10 TaxID=2153357 RepID=UPI000F5B57EF|nr:FecR domain-containing protein [Taibaiella sp. KBW10]RQO29705.1 hypothetical protein DBR32_15325 [Taibaiella sp. KBW10]